MGFYKSGACSRGGRQPHLRLWQAFLFVLMSSPGALPSLLSPLPQTSLFSFFVVFSFRRLLDSSVMT